MLEILAMLQYIFRPADRVWLPCYTVLQVRQLLLERGHEVLGEMIWAGVELAWYLV